MLVIWVRVSKRRGSMNVIASKREPRINLRAAGAARDRSKVSL
jgi:hypothetical protein